MATAKNRALDRLRQRKLHAQKQDELDARDRSAAERRPRRDVDAALDDDIGDDLLRLVFTACHPVLSTEARVALTLRLLGGLTTDEIARAFLVPEADHRAAHRARQAHARRGARAVRGAARATSLRSGWRRCSKSIYLVFNEGYSATAGERLDAPDAVRGRAAPRPHPGRARAARSRKCTASSR